MTRADDLQAAWEQTVPLSPLEDAVPDLLAVVRAAQAYFRVRGTAEWHALQRALAAFEEGGR